jgi:hypothetical protein
MSILGRTGVTSEMQFRCNDCGVVVSGREILDGESVHIVVINKTNPLRSLWRCEICQLELEENS